MSERKLSECFDGKNSTKPKKNGPCYLCSNIPLVTWTLELNLSGCLFNNQRCKSKTLLRTTFIRDFLLIDAVALMTIFLEEAQDLVIRFSVACEAFGLIISIKKRWSTSRPLVQSRPGVSENPHQFINSQTLLCRLMVRTWCMWDHLHNLESKMNKYKSDCKCIWEASPLFMEGERYQIGHKNRALSRSSLDYTIVLIRIMWPHLGQSVGCLLQKSRRNLWLYFWRKVSNSAKCTIGEIEISLGLSRCKDEWR